MGLHSDRYLRALAAFYVRLTFDPVNVYEILEPLLDDYRKIRTRSMGTCHEPVRIYAIMRLLASPATDSRCDGLPRVQS